ncbi:MAG: hypothetical protein JW943_07405 [Deltaproteobacteria bacterium]|nr:hypothetical protein [Deltaproteobacteria bacterium]
MLTSAEKEQLDRIEALLNSLLSIFGKGEKKPHVDTPAKMKADIDEIVVRFKNRQSQKSVAKNG